MLKLKTNKMKNQIILHAPKLGHNQKWKVDGYLVGRHVRSCPRTFEEFTSLQYIGQSNGSYHFIGDGSKVLICSIQVV